MYEYGERTVLVRNPGVIIMACWIPDMVNGHARMTVSYGVEAVAIYLTTLISEAKLTLN